MEEAGTIAAEYISSLENLPAEITHHLAEIRHRENTIQDVHQKIQEKSKAYMRQSSKFSTNIPVTVQAEYDEIDRLSEEKIEIARRIQKLISKAAGRLEVDLARVLVASGEAPAPDAAPSPAGFVNTFSGGTRTPATQVVETIRRALTPEPSPTPVSSQSAGPMKRRRLNRDSSLPTISLGSPAPSAPAPPIPPQVRSRLASQIHPRASPPASRRTASSVAPDEDAEGEDDLEDPGEEGADPEDQTPYCFCRKVSYGEMVGCDNPNCNYQWFHLSCVGLKPPLPDNWYCSECAKELGVSAGEQRNPGSNSRKGRRR